MARLAAMVFSFWAAGSFAAGLLSLGVFVAPDSRSSLLLPFALLALSATFWRTAMGLWQVGHASAFRVRVTGVLSGPLVGLAVWAVSAPAQRGKALLAVATAWLLFIAAAEWLARRVGRQVASVAPAV